MYFILGIPVSKQHADNWELHEGDQHQPHPLRSTSTIDLDRLTTLLLPHMNRGAVVPTGHTGAPRPRI